MAHLSEKSTRLSTKQFEVDHQNTLIDKTRDFRDVCILRLPSCTPDEYGSRLQGIAQLVTDVATGLGAEATLVTLGEVIDLAEIHAALSTFMRYQHWITIKRSSPQATSEPNALPRQHFGALIHTKYGSSLRHAKTRIGYSYCPACDKTTKDYGGKKHTYHEYGTLISDVWRDIACDLDGDLTPLFERFSDLFGTHPYRELRVVDCRPLQLKRARVEPVETRASNWEKAHWLSETRADRLVLGDCLEELKKIPEASVDFAFADPPYNLGKHYTGYNDDLAITEYFEWCDKWIAELARVLRPGRTCAVLNIPIWAIRHFLFMETVLTFQSWIAWDALGFPVRLIMPAHYAILCFSKGNPRTLPGLVRQEKQRTLLDELGTFNCLQPLAEGFCLRAYCARFRKAMDLDDRGPLTDVWWDIHRLKHNTRRVDHPCQLPPQLMHRLISLFTEPGEIVLDCFDAAGTTTLAAHQLGRRYIGIEISKKYHDLALARHTEVINGINPFRKAKRILTAKNSPVRRMPKRKYDVPKKTLQLDVKRVAKQLGRLPTREEVIKYGKYPIRYYDEFFVSWGEVCAAARTTGMSEDRKKTQAKPRPMQPHLFDIEQKATEDTLSVI